MQAETPQVEEDIQRALADESETELHITSNYDFSDNDEDDDDEEDEDPPPPLTVIDSQRIIECLLQTPRVDTLCISGYDIRNVAVLNIFRDGLPLCTSVTAVNLDRTQLGNEELDRLRPAFYNTSVTKLTLRLCEIVLGGEVLRDLLVGNDTLLNFDLWGSHHFGHGPEVAIGFGQGLADNHRLEILTLDDCHISNDCLANLLPANGMIINSLTSLSLCENDIEGDDGGRQVSLLLQCCPALKVFSLGSNNRLGPLGARALAPGLAAARNLEVLWLWGCGLRNDGVANLIPDGQVNKSLTDLRLGNNNIEGEDGGQQVRLLMQRCPVLKVLDLYNNNSLGPLGARALAPGLAAASHLEELQLGFCGLGNDGVANLVPDGQVNRTLTNLNLWENHIEGEDGGENVVALVARCTNLDNIDMWGIVLSPDQRHRVDMLLDQNRLCKEALALGGSTFPVLFQFVEKAHCHEHGLNAIFVILQNDGDDYFCYANNRAID